ncbi:separase-like protein [Artemisia annua]|uniref:Separase-like protein n=1 Tax=Artemisia annua TaxID=35608 RepID=A0A2U1QN04_ARTAN|nr:separase-like protein [Artemisia annua]
MSPSTLAGTRGGVFGLQSGLDYLHKRVPYGKLVWPVPIYYIREPVGGPMFLEDTRQRAPIILVLDKNIQMLPWERMEASKNQIYQMPSVPSTFYTHYKCIVTLYPRMGSLNVFW